MVIKILVTILARDYVSVRWLEPLDRVGGGVYRGLQATLEDIEGVEKVKIRRYSADVEIATHVASSVEAADAIVEALRDPNSEFQYSLRFAEPNPELEVTNAGKVETL